MYGHLVRFILSCFSIYYIAWPTFIFLVRVTLGVHQIAYVTEYVPRGYKFFLELNKNWTLIPPQWFLFLLFVPCICVGALSIYRMVLRMLLRN